MRINELSATEATLADVMIKLKQANEAHVVARIALGDPTFGQDEVLALLRCSHSHLNNLRRDDKFPDPVTIAGKNAWLAGDVHTAIARLASVETGAKAGRRTPLNRYEKRKAASKAKAS